MPISRVSGGRDDRHRPSLTTTALFLALLAGSPLAWADCDRQAVEGVYQWRERMQQDGADITSAGRLTIRRDGISYWNGEMVIAGQRRLFASIFLYRFTPDCRTLVVEGKREVPIRMDGHQLSWQVSDTKGNWSEGQGRRISALTAAADQQLERAAQKQIQRDARGMEVVREADRYGVDCKPGDSPYTFACQRFNSAMDELARLCGADGHYCLIRANILVARGYHEIGK